MQFAYIVFVQLVNIFTIYLSANIINNIVDKRWEEAYTTVGYVLGINLVRYFVMYLQDSQHIKYIENGVNTFLQNYSLKTILKLNPAQYLEDNSAIKLIVISRGEESIKQIIYILLFELLPTISLVIFATMAVSIYSLTISMYTIATFTVATIWTFLFARYHQKFIKQNIDNWDTFNKSRSETFQHLLLIKNSGVETSYLHKYSNSRLEATAYDIFTWMKANRNGKFRMTFFAFSKAIISLQLIYQAFLGRILVGDVFAIWSWTNQAFENIFNIVRATKNLPKHFAELDKYLNIIDKKPEFDESGDRKFENGDIVFDQVSFQYPKAHAPVIDNLSLTIPKGKKVAFIGFSGSGKSTLIKLLLRIYDWGKGDIRIANKSLRNIHSPSLRQRIGYVEQHVDLFDTSIEENIVFGVIDKKTDKTRINELVHKARIDQFFHRLGDAGLGTIIGERGVKLSGGERQRIGIARALAKDPDILIFDEATASLDTENEKFIQEAIDESSKGRTTIVIAHRLSTVQNSDIIFVMDKGRLVGSGTHEDLLETSHEYRRLLHAQKH